MPLTDSFDSLRFALDCAKILEEMWDQQWHQEGFRVAQIMWGARGPHMNRLPTATAPWAMVLDFPSVVVKIFAGCSSRAHVTGVINGYTIRAFSMLPPAVNAFALAAGDELALAMNLTPAQKSKPQINIGHSLGGMIATLMTAAEHSNPAIWGESRCVTFGTPKVGQQAFVDAIRPMRVIRYMNAGDPVPRIYPDNAESRAAQLLTDPLAALFGNLYMQSHGGCLLNGANPPVADVLPPRVDGDFRGELVAWWNSVSGVNAHPHHVGWYRRTLEALLAPQAAAANPQMPAGNVGEEPRPALRLHDVNQQMAEIAGEFIDAPDPVTPVGTVRPRPWWYYRKLHGVYLVFCSENRVAVFKSRAKAKRMVRGGNLLVNNWERAALGTESQLRDAIGTYLDENAFED